MSGTFPHSSLPYTSRVQTFFTPGDPSKGNLPSWTKYTLKTFSKGVRFSAGVIIDHYLIALAQGKKSDAPPGFFGLGAKEESIASFLAFNLLDHSVQEVEVDPSSSLVSQQDSFTLLRYGENQIVKYGNHLTYIITVESFERIAFVKCEEEINDDPQRKFSKRTAQIYKDCLYVYGKIGEARPGRFQKEQVRNELWSFDLKNRTWKLCETTGQTPKEIQETPSSFIFQDNLCVYRVFEVPSKQEVFSMFAHKGYNCEDLFILNFNSMEWTRVEQKEKYLEPKDASSQLRPHGTLYKDHFVTLKQPTKSNINTLCFLNLHTKNIWTTFDVDGVHEHYAASTAPDSGLMTFKNALLSLTSSNYDKEFSVAILNLSGFGIHAPKSAEEEYLSGLFMSQEKSDVALRVQENVIPAHKEILIAKSKYFAGLFNSNMAESKQDVIEITDCEYEIFKDYLQFVYQETVNLTNEDQAIKLYILADKYVQEDLREKCHSYLISIVSMENLHTILDFAQRENLPQIKNACSKCVYHKMSVENVAEFITYLENQKDPELREENKELENRAFKFILYYFFHIEKKGKEILQICEDFVLKNIEMKTLLDLAIFLSASHQMPEDSQQQDASVITRKIFEEKTVRIREGAFNFVRENAKSVMNDQIAKSLPNAFLTGYILDSVERREASKK